MLKFEFTDVEEDRAASLAQSLRRKLIEHGADPDDLAFAAVNESNMGIGSVLEIASQLNFLGPAEAGLHVAVIAHCLYDLLRREDLTIIAGTSTNKIKIKRSATMSVEELQDAIKQVAQSHDDPK